MHWARATMGQPTERTGRGYIKRTASGPRVGLSGGHPAGARRYTRSRVPAAPGGSAVTDSSADRDPLDRLAEEFVARYRRGERPSLTEYADRLPGRADEVR